MTIPKPAILIPGAGNDNFFTSSSETNQLDWDYKRPEETIAIHRGGTILKFKLG